MRRKRRPFAGPLHPLCSEPGPGDGQDPRDDARPPQPGRVANRKALQLCSQVRRVLTDVLSDGGDDVLRDLRIESVIPAPNSTRLIVAVALTTLAGAVSPADVLARLEQAHSRLRSEVAVAIHRRRTPDLLYRVY